MPTAPPVGRDAPQLPWRLNPPLHPPRTWPAPAPATAASPIQSLYLEGEPYRGSPTRVFTFVGLPEGASTQRPAPGMVLVHGGGATALSKWVRLWNARGYAAVAMDTCGQVSDDRAWNPQPRPRHEWSGPMGWGGFDAIDEPLTDQWAYHATAAVLRAHALLRARPEVDPQRIGITGVSWGGFLTCLAVAHDPHFACAAPVYGCGAINDDTAWRDVLAQLGPDRAARWRALWDPIHHLPHATPPLLWTTGTADQAYPLSSLQWSYRLPRGPRTLCVRINLNHGHDGPGERPAEVHAFAEHHLRGGPPLVHLADQGIDRGTLWCAWDQGNVVRAERVFTADAGPWPQRRWEFSEADLDRAARRACAPAAGRCCFLNLTDDRGLVVSTEHVTLD